MARRNAGLGPELLEEFRQVQVGQRAFGIAIPEVRLDMLLFSVLPSLGMALYVAIASSAGAGLIVLAGTLLTWSITFIATDVDRLTAWGPFTAVILAGLALSSARAGPLRGAER